MRIKNEDNKMRINCGKHLCVQSIGGFYKCLYSFSFKHFEWEQEKSPEGH